MLPLHYAAYVADVACKKAAAANVESVFSGAGKFTAEAPSAGKKLLSLMVKLHYNWKFDFLRPSKAAIIARYNLKFRPTVLARQQQAAVTVAATAAATPVSTATAAAADAAAA